MNSKEDDIARRTLQFAYDCIREDLEITEPDEMAPAAAEILSNAAVGGMIIRVRDKLLAMGVGKDEIEAAVVDSADDLIDEIGNKVIGWANETMSQCREKHDRSSKPSL